VDLCVDRTHVLHTAPKASSSHKSTLAAFHCNNQGPLTSPQNVSPTCKRSHLKDTQLNDSAGTRVDFLHLTRVQLWAVVMGARARNFVPFQRDVLLPPDMPRRRATIRLRPSPFRSTLHQLSGRDSDDCTPVSSRDCTPVSSRRLPATPRLSPLRNQRESGQGVDGTSGEVGHGGAGEVRVRGGAFGLSPSHRGLQALSSVFGSTQGPRTPIRPLQASIRFFPHLSPFSQAQFFLSPADSSPGPGPFEMQEDQALPIVLEDEALQSASDGEVNRRGLLLMHVAEEALEQVRDHVTGTVVVREIVFELLDLIFEEAERRDKENHGPAAAENANLAGKH
jgi:hypothetical protein